MQIIYDFFSYGKTEIIHYNSDFLELVNMNSGIKEINNITEIYFLFK